MNTNNNEAVVTWIVRIIAAIILIIIIAHFFFIPEVCDVDRQYLWCRAHPMKFIDILGLIIFIGGFWFLILGGRPFYNRDIYASKGSVYSWIGLAVALLGLGLIYLF